MQLSPDAVLSQEGVVIHNSAREVAPLRRPPHIDAPPHQLVGEKRPGALCEGGGEGMGYQKKGRAPAVPWHSPGPCEGSSGAAGQAAMR